MAKKDFVAPPVLLYREIIGVHKVVFWGLFGLPAMYYVYLFMRQIVICTDQKYVTREFWITAILVTVMGGIVPWFVRKYKFVLEVYSDGIYIKINWIREQDMAMRFKNLAFYTTVKNIKEYSRAGKDEKTTWKFRAMLLTGFNGILLVNIKGGQFMLPTNDPEEVSKFIERKEYLR